MTTVTKDLAWDIVRQIEEERPGRGENGFVRRALDFHDGKLPFLELWAGRNPAGGGNSNSNAGPNCLWIRAIAPIAGAQVGYGLTHNWDSYPEDPTEVAKIVIRRLRMIVCVVENWKNSPAADRLQRLHRDLDGR